MIEVICWIVGFILCCLFCYFLVMSTVAVAYVVIWIVTVITETKAILCGTTFKPHDLDCFDRLYHGYVIHISYDKSNMMYVGEIVNSKGEITDVIETFPHKVLMEEFMKIVDSKR